MKTSQYLENKCKNLLTAIRFFSGGNGTNPGKVRRYIFMAQLDFWDWEMEELIFTFKNFKERQQIWNSAEAAQKSIVEKKLLVSGQAHENYIDWQESFKFRIKEEIISPDDKLQQVITEYNKLLVLCTKDLFSGNLTKYHKVYN